MENDNNFWKKKNVVVTGASGFLGQSVALYLHDLGANVTAITHKNIPCRLQQASIKIVNADLMRSEDCLSIFNGQQILLNFAGLDGGRQYKKSQSTTMLTANIKSIINIMEAAKQHNLEKILLISSAEIYSQASTTQETKNLSFKLLDNVDGYTWSKRFTEIIAHLYRKEHGLNIIAARVGNIYGPHDHANRDRVIPTFIQKALQNNEITIMGSGEQLKSFLYIDDFTAAVSKLIENFPDQLTINFAGGNYISIKNLAEKIIKMTNSKSQLIFQPQESMKSKKIKSTLLKKTIGRYEKTSFEEGLKKTISYFSEIF